MHDRCDSPGGLWGAGVSARVSHLVARAWPALHVLLGLSVLAALGIELVGFGGGSIRLPLPLARWHGGFPVPLVYWASVFLYTWSYGTRLRWSLAERWSRGLCLGVGLHVVALIAHLTWSLTRPMTVSLVRWYVGYVYFVWAVVVVGGVIGIGWWLTQKRHAGRTDAWAFFVPLIGGALAVLMTAVCVPRLVAIGTIGLGVGTGLISFHRNTLHVWSGRLRIVLAREPVFLTIMGVVAFSLRVLYTLRVMTNPDFLNTGSDGPTYDAMAMALVRGETPTESAEVPWWSFHWFSPAYVRFLAAIYWLVGRNYFVVCAVQALLGAWACLLLYAVAKRLFDPTVARIAAIFAALNFPMIFSAAAIGHQAMDLVLTLLVVWGFVRYLEAPECYGRWMFPLGLLLGWAAATREGNIVYWVFLLGWMLLGLRSRLGWPTAVGHALVLSLGVLVVLLPFVWGSGGGLRERMALQWFYDAYTSPPINAWFNPWRDAEAAWMRFFEQPLNVVWQITKGVVANFAMMFLNQDYGSFDPVFLVRGSPYYFGMWAYAYAAAFYGLALVLWGAWRAPRERLGWWLIIGVLVARALPHAFFQATYRHRTPLEPFLILAAAYGVRRLLLIGRPGGSALAS